MVDLVKLYRWNHGKRIDLVVDTDEFSAVHSMGAKWDTVNLSWYITANMETTRFKRWMRDANAGGAASSTALPPPTAKRALD